MGVLRFGMQIPNRVYEQEHCAVTFPPIAIVGRACVLPGALSPGALWERVL